MISINVTKKLHLADGAGELNVQLELPAGSFTALYGASGAGKTTLLRLIAGLDKPQTGNIAFNGQTWLDTSMRINVPPQQRNIGFVFQDYALFPNMTVIQNLEFALPAKAPSSDAKHLLEVMGMHNLAHQKPHLLSGGQKQRIALARALARRPQVLLLDEPLSALDDATRTNLQQELQTLHQQYGLTTIMVSHQIPEICRLATQVIQLHNGSVIAKDVPARVFNLQQQPNVLVGEVLKIAGDEAEVLIGHNIITLKVLLSVKPGDKVTIHTADLSLQKLL